MNPTDMLSKLKHLGVPDHMLNRAEIGWNEIWQPILQLFDQRTIPENGWTDKQIELLLSMLNTLDSDKDPETIRIGEREARIATSILERLSGGFNHGIGRSGDLLAAQPKAAGGSLMQNLTNRVVLSLIRALSLPNVKAALTVPLGTGMALGMALRGLIQAEKGNLNQKPLVLMPRIDHKSPIKGIEFVGGQVLPIPCIRGSNYFAQDGIYMPMENLERIFQQNKERISAIISTTTFFAPRVPDDIKAIAKFAKEHGIIHIINNAYGVQCPEIMKMIRQAIDAGRVDAIVQSTDKNFLTPVGGAVIITPTTDHAEAIGKSYAGRATAGPALQLLIALLSTGKIKYNSLMDLQQQNRAELENQLQNLAKELGEQLIDCRNPVSCAMTLSKLSSEHLIQLSGILYNLRVTGPRVVNPGENNFGTCTDGVLPPYIVMNAAIGITKEDVIESVTRLRKALFQIRR